jgi:predicted Kef-type K+ transport protein
MNRYFPIESFVLIIEPVRVGVTGRGAMLQRYYFLIRKFTRSLRVAALIAKSLANMKSD